MAVSERIVLGSGRLYCVAATKTDGAYVIPADATLEVEGNLLGYIQGGATLEYSPEFYEAKDDLGIVSKKFVTEEEVTLTSGVMTWNADVLKKLASTGVRSTDGTTEIIKIGGAENFDGQYYVLRFVHQDKIDGDIRITIVGSNEAGFSMQFQKDQETVLDAEFKAAPMDKTGALVEVRFTAPTASSTPANPQ